MSSQKTTASNQYFGWFLIIGPILGASVRFLVFPPLAASGYATGSTIGFLVGSWFSISIGIGVLLRSRAKTAAVDQPPLEQLQTTRERKIKSSKRAYRFGIVALLIAGCLAIPLTIARSEAVAVALGSVFAISLLAGLAAVVGGKALSESAEKY